MSAATRKEPDPGRNWTFLSNHAHVLTYLASAPDPRLKAVAEHVGITERAVQKILDDLETEGILSRQKVGRANHYSLDLDQPLRHPLEAHRTVRELIQLLTGKKPARKKPKR